MKIYKISQTIYRGDTAKINMQDYDPAYGTKTMGKEMGSMRGGPGIYFTTSEKDAESYGEHVTKVNLENANILQENEPPFYRNKIFSIIKQIGKDVLQQASSNWDENFNIGIKLILDSIMDTSDNAIDQLMGIWANVFQHQYPTKFMELMTANGIDGFAVQRPETTHYVIYNKALLK